MNQPEHPGLSLLLSNLNRGEGPERPANTYHDPATGELLTNSPGSEQHVAAEGLAKVIPFRPRGGTQPHDPVA